MPLRASTRLGPYEILAPIGAGGMGEVYRARDPRLGRDVAIKVLPEHLSQDSQALARFEREARAVAALSHPNILAIFDVGTDQGIGYVVTELLEGETLRGRLRTAPCPGAKQVRWESRSPKGSPPLTSRGSFIGT
jgi:eukaryotic-like serine/threonine-protein kinase